MATPDPPSPELTAYPPLIQRLLSRRGIVEASVAHAFLNGPTPARPDPMLLPDIEPAIRRILAAIAGAELVAVYGDYDVDGISATAILSEGLHELGGHVVTYIPNRFSEGYGVNSAALRGLRRQGAGLVVTVDCGIAAVEEVRQASEIGLDVIVLDHHEPPPVLPRALAVIDPKRADARYPTRELCSGGLALRLLEALYDAASRPLDADRYLDLAALATVCDMVPLQGENRELVKAGLAMLHRTRRPGLRALIEISGAAGEAPNAELLSYRIGPRLNAAGRLGDASEALELLTTTEPARARVLAQRLHETNHRRQELVEAANAVANELAIREPADAPVLLVGAPEISRGIVGLIATRLVETYQRPAFVYEAGAEECVGSARGVAGFDVVAALRGAAGLLTRHGGHRAAGGFSVPPGNIAAFREHLMHAAWEQSSEPDAPLEVDAEAGLGALDGETLQHLWRFAPCGMGNPTPLLLSRGVTVAGRSVTADGKHLQLRLQHERRIWRGIAFGQAAALPSPGSRLDIVYSVDAGRRNFGPQLRIKDLRAAQREG